MLSLITLYIGTLTHFICCVRLPVSQKKPNVDNHVTILPLTGFPLGGHTMAIINDDAPAGTPIILRLYCRFGQSDSNPFTSES